MPLFSSFSAAASAAACALCVVCLLAWHAKIVRDVCDIFAATSCPPAPQSTLSSLPPPHSSFRQRYRVTNLKMTTDVSLQEDQLCLCILCWIKPCNLSPSRQVSRLQSERVPSLPFQGHNARSLTAAGLPSLSPRSVRRRKILRPFLRDRNIRQTGTAAARGRTSRIADLAPKSDSSALLLI